MGFGQPEGEQLFAETHISSGHRLALGRISTFAVSRAYAQIKWAFQAEAVAAMLTVFGSVAA